MTYYSQGNAIIYSLKYSETWAILTPVFHNFLTLRRMMHNVYIGRKKKSLWQQIASEDPEKSEYSWKKSNNNFMSPITMCTSLAQTTIISHWNYGNN